MANRASFERRGLRSTQDIANSLPGVNASAPPGFGGFVTYRGFSSNQVNQLFNGIPVQYSSAMRPLDDWIVDRVELVGGPSSFLNGAGAVGGSLDYISKLADRYGDFMEGRVRYGSYDDSEVAFGFNQALGIGPEPKHFVRLDVSRSGGNGYVDRNSRESWNVAFSLLSDLTPDLSHTLALEYQDEQEDSPYWGTPVLNPYAGELKIDKSRRRENYNVADGRYEQRVRWLRSILEYRVSDSTRWRNTFYHYDAERDYRNLETYRYNADNSGVVRSNAFLQRHDQQLNGNRFELQHSQPLFGLASDWALGFDYSINKQTRFPSTASGPFGTVDPASFEPGHFYDLPGMRPGHRKDRSNEVRTSALFAENRLGLTDELSLVTGLRYDHLDLDVRNHRTVTASDPAHFERRWDVLTGRAGLVYQFTPHANVYLQYSTAADPPGGVLTSASFGQVRDYDLSTGDQWELGSKFDFLEGRGSATWPPTASSAGTSRWPTRTTPTSACRWVSRPPGASRPPPPADHPEASGRGQFRLGRRAVRRVHRERRRRRCLAQGQDAAERAGAGRQPVADLRLRPGLAGRGGRALRILGVRQQRQHLARVVLYGLRDFPQLPAGRAHADHRARAQPHRRGLRALRAEHAAVLRRRPAHLRAERADALLRSRR